MKKINQLLLTVLLLLIIFFGLFIWFNPEEVRDWNNRYNKEQIEKQKAYDIVCNKRWRESVNLKNDKRHGKSN